MPMINFGEVEDVQQFTPIPPGRYPFRVERVEEAETQNGDEMWRLGLRVLEGKYAGRWVFDNLVFSKTALKRVKSFCKAVGIDVNGDVDLESDALRGRKGEATVDIEEYVDLNGKATKRNVVPFTGYEPAAAEAEDEDALPF
jgi:hypothetical protein